jgi:hypothetical protein
MQQGGTVVRVHILLKHQPKEEVEIVEVYGLKSVAEGEARTRSYFEDEKYTVKSFTVKKGD